MITFELSERDARTVICALNHLISGATATAASNYGIDTFCRCDTADRLAAIKADIVSAIPDRSTTKPGK